jgi:hypothetical protein
MKSKRHSIQNIGLLGILFLLSACAPASVSEEAPAVSTEAAAVASAVYQPVSTEVCQILQEGAAESLGLTFTMEMGTPFTDYASGETGLGCTLTATTNGALIPDPYDALTKLTNGFIGWTLQSAYDAGGPTGAATAMTRDSGLLLISVGWEPAPDANCPADQPISACELTPEQKLYTVKIEAAQK